MRGLLKIATKDPYLSQKLRWELCEEFDRIEIQEDTSSVADVWIYDCRLGGPVPKGENIFYLTDKPYDALPAARCLSLPLPLGLARERLKKSGAAPSLIFLPDERAVLLHGEHIRLTEVELALLRALAEAKGEFLCREALLSAVWGNEGTDSLLNVYIHYLREKLERSGEKMILSSRKGGYALTKKILEGESGC